MGKSMDLQTFDGDYFRPTAQDPKSESKEHHGYDRDRYKLARAGKEQVLKVRSSV